MTGTLIALIVILAVLFLIVVAVIGIYNSLVRLRNQVDNAWSQIDVQLKRRHDLIPNLVETTKGYQKHERETFEAITKARSAAMGAKTVAEAGQAEGQLTAALSRFMMVMENYPDLKANQNFLALQEEDGQDHRRSIETASVDRPVPANRRPLARQKRASGGPEAR